MLIFIGLSLGLSVLVEFADTSFLVNDIVLYGSLISALAAIISAFFKKFSDTVSYDWFSVSTLFVWFAYWKPLFEKDSPMFFFYPLYFSMMSALIIFLLNNQVQRIDKPTKEYMQRWEKERAIPAWALMSCVLGSLAALQHYQAYPVLMTLLVLRFAFSMCLE
ncbi:hypothetical protein DOJK_01462 [Patescibacteria group bacterium]|nr:hypothetical protein DOJK_01462 [Patescibacteria group bacterium]